jgi:hypothetical protein
VPILNRLGATEPNISAFINRGGKLLMYGGWNDTAIPTRVATSYYESVVKAVGDSKARDAVRLFMIPDMGHCPAAATAQDGYLFDPLPLLEAWKQSDKAPATITVRHRTAGVEDRVTAVQPYSELKETK